MKRTERLISLGVVDEIAPATIPQKMQSGSAFTEGTVCASAHG